MFQNFVNLQSNHWNIFILYQLHSVTSDIGSVCATLMNARLLVISLNHIEGMFELCNLLLKAEYKLQLTNAHFVLHIASVLYAPSCQCSAITSTAALYTWSLKLLVSLTFS